MYNDTTHGEIPTERNPVAHRTMANKDAFVSGCTSLPVAVSSRLSPERAGKNADLPVLPWRDMTAYFTS